LRRIRRSGAKHTIDRFAYAFNSPRDDGMVVFRAKDLGREEVLDAAPQLPQAKLPLHRGVYERMVRDHNDGRAIPATITTTVDAPLGSGLGSSSALVVALVDAFRALLRAPLGQYDVAHLAFEIEPLDIGLVGGKQDQYAAAFGDTNFIEFLAEQRVAAPRRRPNRLRRLPAGAARFTVATAPRRGDPGLATTRNLGNVG
jgi:D-glycero-alpha-D-manno-heptose-7-phosphate kinase